jgi:hypothetical protein
MKNAFDIFKKTFQKLLTKFDLHVSFVLNAFIFYIVSYISFFDLKLNLMFKG